MRHAGLRALALLESISHAIDLSTQQWIGIVARLELIQQMLELLSLLNVWRLRLGLYRG